MHNGATHRIQCWKAFLLKKLFFELPARVAPASISHNGGTKTFRGGFGGDSGGGKKSLLTGFLWPGGVKDHSSPFLHVEVI